MEKLFDRQRVRNAAERDEDRRQLQALLARVDDEQLALGYWERVVDGLIFLDEDHWDYQQRRYIADQMKSLRDRQMAENLLWLRARHPNERFIVLNHNGHIVRESLPTTCRIPEHYHGPDPIVPMGRWLASRLGPDYVAIGLSAASGQSGLPRGEVMPVEAAGADSLEFAALGAGTDWIFLDRATLRAQGPRASGHLTEPPGPSLEWARFFDGLIAFSRMTPNRLRPGCTRL